MDASKYQPVAQDSHTPAIVIQKGHQYLENAPTIDADVSDYVRYRDHVKKYATLIRRMAIVQSVLAIATFILGCLCFARAANIYLHSYRRASYGCHLAEGIWCGLLVSTTAILGIFAIHNGAVRSRCLLMGYFVMNIIMCIVVFIHGFLTILWTLASIFTSKEYSESAGVRGLSIFINLTLSAMAIAMFVSQIVVLAFTCTMWTGCCGGVNPMTSTTVVYLHTTGNDDDGANEIK